MSSAVRTKTRNGQDYRSFHCWFTIVILAWAPFPLGSIHPWAMTVLAAMVTLQLALLVPSALADKHAWQVPPPLWVAAILMGGVLVWIQVQTWIGLSASWHADLWQRAETFGLNVEPRISLSATDGQFEQLRLLTALGMFMIMFVLAQSRRQANRLLDAIMIICAGYGVFGLGQLASGQTIFEQLFNTHSLTSTFVNRNHAATFLNIGLLIGIARLIEPTFDPHRAARPSRWRTHFVAAVKNLFEQRQWLTLLVTLLIASSIATLSRGGFLSIVVAIVFLLIVGLRGQLFRGGVGWIVLGLVLAAFGAIAMVGGEDLLRRFDDIGNDLDVETAGRIAIWSLTIELIGAAPWTGYGFGVYDHLFAMHRDERFFLFFDYAHNDWLQLIVELGIPAASAFLLACAIVFFVNLHGTLTRQRGRLPALVAASTFVLVAVHALVDFSLAMPAVMCTVATVAGIGCAQSRRRSERRRSGAQPTDSTEPASADETAAT